MKEREKYLAVSHLLVGIWLSIKVYESSVFLLLVYDSIKYRVFVREQHHLLMSLSEFTDLIVWSCSAILLYRVVKSTMRLTKVIMKSTNNSGSS